MPCIVFIASNEKEELAGGKGPLAVALSHFLNHERKPWIKKQVRSRVSLVLLIGLRYVPRTAPCLSCPPGGPREEGLQTWSPRDPRSRSLRQGEIRPSLKTAWEHSNFFLTVPTVRTVGSVRCLGSRSAVRSDLFVTRAKILIANQSCQVLCRILLASLSRTTNRSRGRGEKCLGKERETCRYATDHWEGGRAW
jgi:hypothetical protein